MPFPVPSTVILLMLTGPARPELAATSAKRVIPNADGTEINPEVGTVITTSFEFPLETPTRVNGVGIVICSAYVPGQTCMVVPAGALLTAACIVLKLGSLGYRFLLHRLKPARSWRLQLAQARRIPTARFSDGAYSLPPVKN